MDPQKILDEGYAVDALYQEHGKPILAYLDRHTSAKEDAEDLLLEVFLAAIENQVWVTLKTGQQRAWLRKVAQNKLIDHYRHNARYAVVTLDTMFDALYEDEDLQPEQVALRHEAQEVLYLKMAQLPELQQEVLRLRFANGLHTKEIAVMLKKTDAAVRILLSRTLNQLRCLYEHHQH